MTSGWALRKISAVDPLLAVCTAALLLVGIVMVYSASSPTAMERHEDGTFFLRRHVTYLMVGFCSMAVMFYLRIQWLRKAATVGLIAAGLLLAITALTPIGLTAKNATRWLAFGGLTFQPSELAKPLLINYVAAYLTRKREILGNFTRGVLPLLATVGSVFILLLRQPDFGTTAVLAIVTGLMLFTSRTKWTHIAALGGVSAIAAAALIVSAPYRWRRVSAFLHPWTDAQGGGFQIIQSFIAFQRGGAGGQGLGDGIQKLLYLPEAHTDFIYSVVAEELGLGGSLAVLFLYAAFVVQGLRLSLRLKEAFASRLALGITALIGVQALLNMAVVMGVVPTKGMTLPLVSYGGTSLVATMAALGVLLSLSATVSLSRNMARKWAL